jgi:hypothetical protein
MTRKKIPASVMPAGIFVMSRLALFENHQRERIDIGLQHHEQTDETG